MKNSFKLLVFWLLTPLLFFGVSFSYNNIFDDFSDNIIFSWNLSSKDIIINVKNWNTYCYDIKNTSSNLWSQVSLHSLIYNNNYCQYLANNFYWNWLYCFKSPCDNSNFSINPNSNSSFDLVVYEFEDSFSSSSDCSNDSNYLTCLDRVNQLNWQVWTLSWNLSTCQTNYNSCLSDSSHCDTLVGVCQENLSWCQETNLSLQNYNDSLNSQLQECLENWTWWSWWNYIALYDIFRSSDWNDYSLPITNNIHLPLWYRGFLDEGVLAIKRVNTLDSAYSISDEDYKDKIVWSYSTIFLFFVSSGLFLVFLFAIRRYFIWLKSFR